MSFKQYDPKMLILGEAASAYLPLGKLVIPSDFHGMVVNNFLTIEVGQVEVKSIFLQGFITKTQEGAFWN